MYSNLQIARVLDLAFLHPNTGSNEITMNAEYYGFLYVKSICVASTNVAAAVLGHPYVTSVIGFPHGNVAIGAKLREAEDAIRHGAKELDVVINYGRFLGGDYGIIYTELSGITAMAHREGVMVKAILEVCHYSYDDLEMACQECIAAEVDFIKTSTGFGPGGATLPVIERILNHTKGTGVKVKASGGIKTYEDVVKYLDAGVHRLGASKYLELCSE
jgi:deoxyribose-phosphate aldolase